jgi:hypothetical protein
VYGEWAAETCASSSLARADLDSQRRGYIHAMPWWARLGALEEGEVLVCRSSAVILLLFVRRPNDGGDGHCQVSQRDLGVFSQLGHWTLDPRLALESSVRSRELCV